LIFVAARASRDNQQVLLTVNLAQRVVLRVADIHPAQRDGDDFGAASRQCLGHDLGRSEFARSYEQPRIELAAGDDQLVHAVNLPP
jgi:hypothetical protein